MDCSQLFGLKNYDCGGPAGIFQTLSPRHPPEANKKNIAVVDTVWINVEQKVVHEVVSGVIIVGYPTVVTAVR